MKRPVIVIGGGGHARVLIDALKLLKTELIGVTDIDPHKTGTMILGLPVLGTDEVIMKYKSENIFLVNGIGSVGLPILRTRIFNYFKQLGYSFMSVIHPSAILAADITLGEGVQVMAGAVLQTGCRIGENSIINTAATIDHDCNIGSNVHIAPRVVLSGGVTIGNGVHVGTGTVMIQGVTIGENSLIGAGTLVLKTIPASTKVIGVPAREV